MPDLYLAHFVIERDPVRDYQISQQEGCQADELRDFAKLLLDEVGQPRPSEKGVLHGYIGPTGPRKAYYVRILVERLPRGELRFFQWWFSVDELPARPARCGSYWPADIERIVSLAKKAQSNGKTQQASIHPAADPLAYCDGLIEAFGNAQGPKISWITEKTDRPVPVNLQFIEDPELDEPKFSSTSLRLLSATSQPPVSRRVDGPKTDRRRTGVSLPLGLLVAGLLLGGVGGYVVRGMSGPGRNEGEGRSPVSQYAAPIPAPVVVPQTADRQPDPAVEALRLELLSSYDAVQKLEQFLGQPGLGKDEGQTQIRETVVMTDLLDFGSVDKQKFDNLEVRKLVDVLQKLTRLHPSQAEQSHP